MATFKSIGKFRRHLRAIAANQARTKSLHVMQISGNQKLSEAFCEDVRVSLKAHELVQIKTRLKKKKDTAVFGAELASMTGSEVAQIVGHSVLLFQSNDKDVTRVLLDAHLQQTQKEQTEEGEEIITI